MNTMINNTLIRPDLQVLVQFLGHSNNIIDQLSYCFGGITDLYFLLLEKFLVFEKNCETLTKNLLSLTLK